MSDEKKSEIKIEDRRHFDQEGNPIHSAEEKIEQEKSEPPEPAEPAGDLHRETEPSSPPQIDFAALLFSYVHTAMVHLGDLQDPVSRKTEQNLEGARQMIDILEVLEQKTRGNLTGDEQQYLQASLFDLRMRFLQKAKIIK